MYARVTSGAGDPDRLAKAIREQVLPAAEKMEGFKGLLSLVDRQSGDGFSITLWESEEALRKSEEAANKLRQEVAEASSTTIASVKRYEVIVATGVAEPVGAGTSR